MYNSTYNHMQGYLCVFVFVRKRRGMYFAKSNDVEMQPRSKLGICAWLYVRTAAPMSPFSPGIPCLPISPCGEETLVNSNVLFYAKHNAQ